MPHILGIYDVKPTHSLVEYDLARYKSIVLRVFENYDHFCRTNNLRYSVAYGTMLGAIRHRGFIPWDDDVDVMMPRPDYDRFIELTLGGMGEGYEVISPYTRADVNFRFAKVADARTTLIEKEDYKGCLSGVFIDVFALDGLNFEDDTINDRRHRLVRRHANAAVVLSQQFLGGGLNLKEKLIWLVYKLLGSSSQKELLRAEKIAKQTPFEEASAAMTYGWDDHYRDSMPTCLFDNIIEVDFETLRVKCLAKYDFNLTNFYGDYMTLPPPELQVPGHTPYFIDLDRRWTREELRKAKII